jgi:16S rRNA C967 or C1407 C5-methylase (RsmB/RsmF family)
VPDEFNARTQEFVNAAKNTKNLANGKHTTIYLTSTWVKQRFEGEYVQRLNKLLDLNEFVNIRNIRANPTKKVQNEVLDFQHNLHT